LQILIKEWVIRSFGEAAFQRREERAARVVEEALELAQACTMTKEEAQKILDVVYSRPRGNIMQEAGGVALTLLALAESRNFDLQAALQEELRRVLDSPSETFRARHQEKIKLGISAPRKD
jgi:NTP pyrophosphatase (non-canonical NTP hydrolase)